MFNGYGLGGATKDIKLTPEEVEKLKSNLIEWDGEFYPKIFEWKNSEDLYRACVKLQLEIEKLNNKLKDIKSQLDYLETYSSKEDVFEDMKRRLDRIDKIIGSDKE